MLELTQREQSAVAVSGQLTLDFESRQRSRLRTRLDDGREAAILLDRGQVLRGGERLRASTGEVVLITAANETLSEVRSSQIHSSQKPSSQKPSSQIHSSQIHSSQIHSDDARELARAAYHLGNRHVAVEVGVHWLRYLHDHVLDDMLRGLGLEVSTISAGFEPEAGAYAGAHTHSHDHSHGHRNAPDHGFGHEH
jgi:urease accessory protein